MRKIKILEKHNSAKQNSQLIASKVGWKAY
jgi:hypothetical protein